MKLLIIINFYRLKNERDDDEEMMSKTLIYFKHILLVGNMHICELFGYDYEEEYFIM